MGVKRTVFLRIIDSQSLKLFDRNKIRQKNAKENSNISFVFQRQFLYNFPQICDSYSTLQKEIKTIFSS